MKVRFLLALFALFVGVSFRSARAQPNAPVPLQWVTGYYPGWEYDRLKPKDVDFRTVTHLVHFAAMPKADGRLDFDQFGVSLDRSREVMAAAHAAKRQALLCVGGADSAPGFRGATSQTNRGAFVQAVSQAVRERGYDGIDVDWEPLEAGDAANFALFIRELRAANPKATLTAAVGAAAPAGVLAGLADQFDQINVMTYDLSGAWPGWVTWHNAPLSNGGLSFPNGGLALPSVPDAISVWTKVGIPARKLGLGLPFYGYVWNGVTEPNQSAEGVKTYQLPFSDVLRRFPDRSTWKWDERAQVPYISVVGKTPGERAFVSFDDERSLLLKVAFARQQGLGGAIIWELGSAYLPDAPTNQRDPLLQAVRQAAFSAP